VAALAFLTMDVVLNLVTGPHSHWQRALGILHRPLGLTLKGTSLYLGELYRTVLGPGVLDPDYAAGSAYATAWPLGALYLAAVVGALRQRQDAERFLGVVFAVVFAAATLVDGRRLFDPFWWASLSFPPAVLLAGRMLARLGERIPRGTPLVAVGLAIVALYDVTWLGRAGTRAPRLSRQEWAQRLAEDGQQRLSDGDRETAREQAAQALLLDADNAAARALLARLP